MKSVPYCMPRPSVVLKIMGSLSPSLWMYSNVNSRKQIHISKTKQKPPRDKKFVDGLLQKKITHQLISQSSRYNHKRFCFKKIKNKFQYTSLTFTLHVFDQVTAKSLTLQLFIQVKHSFSFNFIIGDSIVLIAALCSRTLKTNKGFQLKSVPSKPLEMARGLVSQKLQKL